MLIRAAAVGCLVAILFFFSAVERSAVAASACAEIPSVFWWGDSAAEKITERVNRQYGGSWDEYLASWQRRLDRLRKIQERGSQIAIENRGIVLGGRGLELYIGVVEERLAVTRCLAKEATASAGTPDVLAGQKLAQAVGCVGCHGEFGLNEHPMIPNLAGQRPEYLRAQLWLFRAGAAQKKSGASDVPARHDRLMTGIAGHLSDQNISDLAAYFASLSCRTSSFAENVERPKKVERCAACHGEDGRSGRGGFPHLAGQKEGYLKRQLTLLRDSTEEIGDELEDADLRHHGIMGRQAEGLSLADVDVLARYYAGLPCH